MAWEYLGILASTWEYLWKLESIWEHMAWEYLPVFGSTCENLMAWELLSVLESTCENLRVFGSTWPGNTCQYLGVLYLWKFKKVIAGTWELLSVLGNLGVNGGYLSIYEIPVKYPDNNILELPGGGCELYYLWNAEPGLQQCTCDTCNALYVQGSGLACDLVLSFFVTLCYVNFGNTCSHRLTRHSWQDSSIFADFYVIWMKNHDALLVHFWYPFESASKVHHNHMKVHQQCIILMHFQKCIKSASCFFEGFDEFLQSLARFS